MMEVCVPCEKEFKVETVGIVIAYHRHLGELPFKACYADLRKCPECKHEIVTGFGDMVHRPDWPHATEGEKTYWDQMVRVREDKGLRVIHVF